MGHWSGKNVDEFSSYRRKDLRYWKGLFCHIGKRWGLLWLKSLDYLHMDLRHKTGDRYHLFRHKLVLPTVALRLPCHSPHQMLLYVPRDRRGLRVDVLRDLARYKGLCRMPKHRPPLGRR